MTIYLSFVLVGVLFCPVKNDSKYMKNTQWKNWLPRGAHRPDTMTKSGVDPKCQDQDIFIPLCAQPLPPPNISLAGVMKHCWTKPRQTFAELEHVTCHVS